MNIEKVGGLMCTRMTECGNNAEVCRLKLQATAISTTRETHLNILKQLSDGFKLNLVGGIISLGHLNI